jgi:hypothetical protein
VRMGDIYVFTIFNDGIARRFDLNTGVYANCKMSIPAWYYSGDEYLSIRGRQFRSVRAPELVLEKVYGENWRTPLKPGEFQDGRNKTSGAVVDADIEKLILYAVANGWDASDIDGPAWPQPIHWIGWVGGSVRFWKEWILRHEPLIHPELAGLIQDCLNSAPMEGLSKWQIATLLKTIAAKAIQFEKNSSSQIEANSQKTKSMHNLNWLKIPLLIRAGKALKILSTFFIRGRR